ncbi:MAG: prolyl hydroxylase family protein [Roseiarcus sp.]
MSLARRLKGERIVALDGFVSAEDCALMREELNYAFWRPSAVHVRRANGALEDRLSLARISDSAHETWFSKPLRACVRRMERRIGERLGAPTDNFEPWQATRYARHGRFDAHFDSGHWSAEPAGERQTTLLVYLTTPSRGGGTWFPRLNREFAAKTGRLLIWDNLMETGETDREMLHAACPLTRGSKITLVTWVRERAVRTGATQPIASRPADPERRRSAIRGARSGAELRSSRRGQMEESPQCQARLRS